MINTRFLCLKVIKNYFPEISNAVVSIVMPFIGKWESKLCGTKIKDSHF